MKKTMNLIAVALCAICAQAVEFSYDVNRDGTITLRDVRGSVPADLVIPSEIDDRKVTGIGKGFCKECDSLKSVKFPESLLVIADDCFAECGKLRSVELNEGLLEIGDDFCEDCSNLTSIVIPSTVEHIAHSFCACAGESKGGITAMSVRPGNETFAVDGGILYDKKTGVVILAEVDISVARIPEGTRAIGECAFWGCRNLTLIEWPKSSSVEYIDDEAFVFCRALQSIDIPEGVREIHEEAFVGCRGLISVHLPSTLEVIASHAFGNCDALKSVTFAGGVPRIDNSDEETDARFPAGDIYVTGSEVGHYTKRIVGVVSYVLPDKGWDAIVATGTWQGCLIKFAGDDQSQSDMLESSYGPFVPGEKVSLTIPALVGYAAKGLPSGLKLNKKTGEIAGAAKKSTGDAGVTVTFTKKNEPTLTAHFVVGPMLTIEIALAGDTEKCKVKGAGSYLVGKKVSLSATAPKGTAFVGWTANGVPWPNAEDSKKAKLSYVMTKESVSLVATFEKEKMRVACSALAAASFTVGVAGDATGIPIEIETQSGVKSVAVSKLPAGMKYDKKAGLIVGAPTKAGSFDVTIKVTAKSGAVETLVVPVRVAALPDWAAGTFGGMIGRFIGPKDDDEFRPYGMITMKITTAGKISAKITAGGKTYSFSAKGFDAVDEDGDYYFRMTTKKGEVYEGEISATYHDVAQLVKKEDVDDPEGLFTIVGHEPYFAIVWRNEHGKDGRLSADSTGKAKKVMDAIKAFKTVELAQLDPAYGSVVLKIDAKGTTTLSGKTANGVKIGGTSFLMLDDDWYHVISDMVFYDKQSGNVYDVTPCFQPVFDATGNIVDWDWECCEHDLRVYPFE